MSSVPWQHLGIDLNEAVRDPDLEDDLEIGLKQPVRQAVADVYLNIPADPDDVQEVFDLNNPVCLDVNEKDQEEAPWVPDLNNLNAADACQKGTPPCCEPDDLYLNEATKSGQVVLLPDLNEIPAGAVGATRLKYSDDTKRAVYAMLLEGSRGGNLPPGLTLQVSLAMGVSLRCVQRIWNAGQKGGGIHAVVNKRAKNCGRKRVEVSLEAINAIPLKDRTTLENVARHLGMAKSTIFRRLKEGRIQRHSIPIQSFLRNEDKGSRARYSLDKLEPQCSSSSGFKSNYTVTHMDRKWRRKLNQKFYCAPGEEILKEQYA